MDLSKISTEDLKSIMSGKYSDVSTAGLQAYQASLQQEAQAQQQSQNPQKIPDAADKAFQGGKDQAQAISNQPNSPLMQYLQKGMEAFNALHGGMIKGASGGNLDPGKMGPQALQQSYGQAMQNNKVLSGAGQLAGGMATGVLTSGAASAAMPAGVLGRIAANTIAGGVMGGAQNPGANGSRLENAGKGALLGGGLSAVGEGIGAAAGSAGDYAMQKAVGMRKNTPGMGTSLADQGLWGTASRMEQQVGSKLPIAEQNVQDLVGSLKGNVNSKDLADAVAQVGNRFESPSGITLQGVQGDLNTVKAASDQFGKMSSDLTPQDVLSLKRQGDWLGYTASGNPATSTNANIGSAIANKARGILSDMSDGASAEALGKERALILAKQALEKPDAIHQGAGSSMFFGKLPGQSLIGSTVGQAAVKTSQAAQGAVDPKLLQGLFGATQSTQNQ